MIVENGIKIQDTHLYIVHRWLYYSEMLAEQCNGWLSAEEGNKNMMQNIMERAKNKKSVIKKQ